MRQLTKIVEKIRSKVARNQNSFGICHNALILNKLGSTSLHTLFSSKQRLHQQNFASENLPYTQIDAFYSLPFQVKNDAFSSVQVEQSGMPTYAVNNELQENEEYSGEDNNLIFTRTYKMCLLCNFNQHYFPFDSQKCFINVSGQMLPLKLFSINELANIFIACGSCSNETSISTRMS